MASVDLPDLSKLTIARHAYERAAERLEIGATAFAAWVAATSRSWLAVNADYFRLRGVDCHPSKWLFLCPWSPAVSLCLPVSNDRCLVTVMVFDPHMEPASARQAELDALRGELARAQNQARSFRGELEALKAAHGDPRIPEIAPGVRLPTRACQLAACRAVATGDVGTNAVLGDIETSGGIAQQALMSYVKGEIPWSALARLASLTRTEAPMAALSEARRLHRVSVSVCAETPEAPR